jgi:hypothetical protein
MFLKKIFSQVFILCLHLNWDFKMYVLLPYSLLLLLLLLLFIFNWFKCGTCAIWTHIAIMNECWKGEWYIFNMLKSNFHSNFNIWLQICSIFYNFCTLGLILWNHVTTSLLIEDFSMVPRAWGGCCDLGDLNVTKQNKQLPSIIVWY